MKLHAIDRPLTVPDGHDFPIIRNRINHKRVRQVAFLYRERVIAYDLVALRQTGKEGPPRWAISEIFPCRISFAETTAPPKACPMD